MALFTLGLLLSLMAIPAMPLALDPSQGKPVQVIYIYSHECTLCQHAGPVIRNAVAEGHTGLTEYEFNSPEGRNYMRMYGVDTVPAVIVNGNVIRFEDYGGDLTKLDALVRAKIEAAENCPLLLRRNVSSLDHDIAVTTCIANRGTEPIKAELIGGLSPDTSVVSGDTSWSGEIAPGGAHYVTYRMKANSSVKALPPQTLAYVDSNGSHDLVGPETPLAVARKLSLAAAFLAGLVAGINPCLLAVMAFISTMTLSSENRGRELVIDVCSFCVGLLTVYLLIGIGFLGLIQGTPTFGDTIRLAIICLLIGFAAWSFYDAYTVNKKPDRRSIFKALVSRIKPLYSRYGVAANFLLGGAFGLVKMPCVGGMYVAILGAIFQSGDPAAGIACLASYNIGVVLPVLALGLLLTLGLSPEQVNAFRLKHRVAMKVVTGALLIAMAAGLALNLI